MKDLLDLADRLDEQGLETEADLIAQHLRKMARKGAHPSGLKEETVDRHRELLDGYQKAADGFRQQLKKVQLSNNETDSPNQGALREILRGISHNHNAVVLHTMYFEDLIDSKPYAIEQTRVLWSEIKERYQGTRNRFLGDIRRAAQTPRSGWVLVSFCTLTGEIQIDIIDLHEIGCPVAGVPIACLDLWEHAYINDFGINREEYIEWALNRLDWRKPEKRLRKLLKIK